MDRLTLFGQRLFGPWVYDFLLAYLFRRGFQYFTIKPMRKESGGKGLLDAVKADTLSPGHSGSRSARSASGGRLPARLTSTNDQNRLRSI